ncbi:PTS sugar transporter subunit IIC [Vagococcus zengguangii]|uniref:PTS sugar transporter subunit IIC n=1 Tax=Vagococcus zengguangii TaxID=2571750 RepID=A0A4D7CNP0_9ENTE|nr:PTS sugar transporter subunit IIC [Vagococcus zengguangii]QCI85695.1 PTS sugar transporter subunit IIC [Vagococcus zengguangii]TLG81637.1 PTS sugar transporter subunit IIC [Vagococcus zengguangii]
MNNSETLSPKVYLNKVLAGTATGIIVGLIPNAVLAAILKFFGDNVFAVTLTQVAVIFQIGTPLIIGALVAMQFGLNPMQMMVTGGASFVGSGVVKFNPEAGAYIGAGTGDIINTMITAALAVGLILLIGNKFGSVAIVATPIVVGCGAGIIGVWLLPYVTKLTTAIGNVINTFTTLQPILMSILIACSFAFLIISPISTVAIGMAIQLGGVSAGAAAMGVAATTIVLVVNSWKVNKSGVTIAVALGAMKMMMPNLFRTPIILLPCLFTAIISAIPVALFSIAGSPASAGFGLVGLVGPLASLDNGLSIILVVICWLLVPIGASLLGQFLFEKVFKLYDRQEVFGFKG